MSLQHTLRVTLQAMSVGFKQANAVKIEILGSYIIYLTILILWSGVIRMLSPDELSRVGLTQVEMIWYLHATELVLFCAQSWGFKEVQDEINSEQAYLGFLRPYSDSFLRMGIWGGESCYRLLYMFPLAVVSGYLLAGSIPFPTVRFIGLFVTLPLASIILLCGVYLVGASCLWFIQSEPAFWVWQKCIFLFGAILWPMIMYPDVMQLFMWFTPFPAILAFCGDWMLSDSTISLFVLHAIHQVIWCAISILLCQKMDRIILRYIQGGSQ